MQIFHIEENDANQRLDKFIKKLLPNAPLGGIYKMLRTGKVKIEGKKRENTYKLQVGEEVKIWLSDEEITTLQRMQDEEIIPKWNIGTLQKEDILYEDDALLILNKSPGINVHPWDHKTDEISLIDQGRDYFWKKYNSLTFRPSLVHRIDRDTSGVIIIAKTKRSLDSMLSQLQSGGFKKIYHTIVLGRPSHQSWTIKKPLLRIEDAHNEAKVRVDKAWLEAITHYSILEIYPHIWDKSASLLECQIETGRTHQIRVHMKSIDCPVLWDEAYGDKKINSFLKRECLLKRQMLHAYSVSFLHPETKKNLTIQAPYKDDMSGVIQYFRKERV